MREIVIKIQELYDTLQVRLAKLEGEKAALARDRVALDKQIAEVKVRDADLFKRELAVKKIEDVVTLTNKAKVDLEVIADKEAKLVRAKDEFEKSCVVRDKILKDLEDQMKVRIRKLDERETTLRENERTYKKKILSNLSKLKEELENQ